MGATKEGGHATKDRSRVQRWLVLPDMQVRPARCGWGVDLKTLSAVEKYMAAHRWDGYLNLGDFADLNELSTYNLDAPGRIAERVDETFSACNEILDRHQAIIRKRNPKARFVLLEGNHDYRATAYTERHPELGKSLSVPLNLRLKERGFEWVPSWSEGKLFKIGHAHFTHGLITSKYHAAVMASRYGVPIYYGHVHSVQEYPLILHGDDKHIVGKSLGCLCLPQPYMKGAPTDWVQAFATFFVYPDGFFTEYTTKIFKHRFVGPDGVTYSG